MKKFSHLLEYLALRFLQSFLSFLPRRIGLTLGSMAGRLIYLCGFYRKIVRKNMEFVNLWPKEEQERITRKLYTTIGRYAVDFLRNSNPQPVYRISNEEKVQTLLDRGKGVIVLMAHFGNWEILGAIFGKKFNGLRVVVKPMRNRLVDTWLGKKRVAYSVETIYVNQALKKMYDGLTRNRLVAVLIDQHAGKQGTLVPFLGKPTSTVRTVAGLVRKTDCGVLSTYSLLQKDGTYDIMLSEAPIPDLQGMNTDEAIDALQRQHNDILSEWVRRYPEHWFGWFHKRFRESIKYNS